MTWLWIALAGGLGAACRHLVHTAVIARGHPSSIATLLVNVVGSFAAGLVAGAAGRLVPADLAPVLAVGFLGGFTTFSTASVEVVKLWTDPTTQRATSLPRRVAAGALAVTMLLGSVAAAAVGWWISRGAW